MLSLKERWKKVKGLKSTSISEILDKNFRRNVTLGQNLFCQFRLL